MPEKKRPYMTLVASLSYDLAMDQYDRAKARLEGMSRSDLRGLHAICHELDRMTHAALLDAVPFENGPSKQENSNA